MDLCYFSVMFMWGIYKQKDSNWVLLNIIDTKLDILLTFTCALSSDKENLLIF